MIFCKYIFFYVALYKFVKLKKIVSSLFTLSLVKDPSDVSKHSKLFHFNTYCIDYWSECIFIFVNNITITNDQTSLVIKINIK